MMRYMDVHLRCCPEHLHFRGIAGGTTRRIGHRTR